MTIATKPCMSRTIQRGKSLLRRLSDVGQKASPWIGILRLQLVIRSCHAWFEDLHLVDRSRKNESLTYTFLSIWYGRRPSPCKVSSSHTEKRRSSKFCLCQWDAGRETAILLESARSLLHVASISKHSVSF